MAIQVVARDLPAAKSPTARDLRRKKFVKKETGTMILQDILRLKGTHVEKIGPDASLDDVVQKLVQHNIGSLVVCECAAGSGEERMIGIVTERDTLRAHAAHKQPLERLTVRSSMSQELITASPDDGIEDAMRLMTEHRVRHLPIVQGHRLLGVISIGDVVKAHHDELVLENHYMRSYIRGPGGTLATPAEP
jgi:CBS domain-containing protein